MKKWKIEIENWRHITIESIQFMFKQSEEALNETVKTFENNSKKTNQMFTLAMSIMTICIGYISDFSSKISELKLAAYFVVIMCGCIIAVLYKNLFFDQIGVKGSHPKYLLKEKYFNKEIEDHEQFLNIILNECEKYQERIDRNKEVNKLRQKRVQTSLYIFMGLPVTIIISKILMSFI